jgi:hypothetical protein
VTTKAGKKLLELRGALRKAERCRCALREMGYPPERWQEIVNSVGPEMRFAARPQIMDAIKIYLESAGAPIRRDRLANEVSALGAGPRPQVRFAIAANLDRGNLILFPGNKVGLPARTRKKTK